MLRLFVPTENQQPEKPWLIRVLEDNALPQWLGLTRQQWILNGVVWAGLLVAAMAIY